MSHRRTRFVAQVAAACALSLSVGANASPFPEQGWRPCREPSTGGDGLRVVPGESPVSGPGPRKRFIVEVHRAVNFSDCKFAAQVQQILYNDRSWGGNGRVAFKKVDDGAAAFRVTLARPYKVDQLCAPLNTNGRYSCFNGYRAVINSRRWKRGAASYRWSRFLAAYRRYLINHEVGHALGHPHRNCPRTGAPAPVMMQQTKGVEPCRRNPWPLTYEKSATSVAGRGVASL